MCEVISIYDTKVTKEWLVTQPESLYYERKGLGEMNLKPAKLANTLIGMLNADGGIVAFGVSDNGVIQDVSSLGQETINSYLKVCHDFIAPTPRIKIEKIYIDHNLIILYHIENNYEAVFRRKDIGKVYKRIADSTIELSLEEIRNLEYDKNLRAYEDAFCSDFDPDDLDINLIEEYQNKINFDSGDLNDLLIYRNLAKRDKHTQKIQYRNSAILLFAKDPDKYIPSSYIRYIRFDGKYAGVGKDYNVVKDIRIQGNIPTVIRKTKELLSVTLSEYYYFDIVTGTFHKQPEYPEDAWLEGIVNAVFHRSYNLQGNAVTIKHYDNRLEISNSGPLPAQVTVDNIKEQRFSRNPRIGRVLYEMEYVRELNEGVKRIYASMDALNLVTKYIDKDDIVTLQLINNAYDNGRNIPDNFYNRLTQKMCDYGETKRQIVIFSLPMGREQPIR